MWNEVAKRVPGSFEADFGLDHFLANRTFTPFWRRVSRLAKIICERKLDTAKTVAGRTLIFFHPFAILVIKDQFLELLLLEFILKLGVPGVDGDWSRLGHNKFLSLKVIRRQHQQRTS